MVFWIILGILVLLIVLIMLIPVGFDIRYEDDIIRISLKAAWLKLKENKGRRQAEKRKEAEERGRTRRRKTRRKEKRAVISF